MRKTDIVDIPAGGQWPGNVHENIGVRFCYVLVDNRGAADVFVGTHRHVTADVHSYDRRIPAGMQRSWSVGDTKGEMPEELFIVNPGPGATVVLYSVSDQPIVDELIEGSELGGGGAPAQTAQATPINAAAVTTTQPGPDQSSGGARGVHVVLNMTNVGTGSVTPKIQGKDAQGNYYDILVGSAITTNGINLLKVYPGIGALANAASPDVIPATFRVVVTANNANATTYTVTTSLVP